MHNTIYKKFTKNCFLSALVMLWGIIPLSAQEDKSKEAEVLTFDLQDEVEEVEDTIETMNVLYRTIDKRDFLGSSVTVYSDQIATTLHSNILASLQGRMQGLYITQHYGINPFYTDGVSYNILGTIDQNFSVGLRNDNNGMFSLLSRGYSPIVIIDGVQRDFTSIDPESIESISIQKDALSGIMLGGRSARSVLLITTKEPIKQGVQLSFSAKYGIQKPLNVPKPLSSYQYAYLLNEAFMNEEKPPAYSYNDFERYRMKDDLYLHPDVNWYDQILKNTSPTQSYNLSATGGSDNVQYRINLGYFREDGLLVTDTANSYNTNYAYDRYLINSKIKVKVTDKLKVGASLLGRIEEGNQPGVSVFSILNSLYTKTANNAYPVYNPNGTFGGNQSHQSNLYANTVHSGYMTTNSRDAMASIDLDYDLSDLLKGLSFSAQGNVTTQTKTAVNRSKQAPVFLYKMAENEIDFAYDSYGASQSQVNRFLAVSTAQQMYGQGAFNYKSNFGKHNLGVTLLGDYQQQLINYVLPKQFANLHGRIDYDYNKKYFAEAAITHSYYNRYAPKNRWGTFYAAGAAWDVSREEFLSDAKWLDQFKIRGVFGNTGNVGGTEEQNYFTWIESYESGGTWGNYTFGTSGGMITTTIENGGSFVNKNMTYERANKLNIGTDITVLNKTLQLTADFYHDDYYNLLQIRGKNHYVGGLEYPIENIGKMWAEGIELALTYQNKIADFNYFVTANWTRETSKLVFMDEQDWDFNYLYHTGKPVGAWYGLICDGFFQSQEEIDNSAIIQGQTVRPGDLKYRDIPNTLDAEGNIVGDGVIDQNDMMLIGNDKPLKYFGLNLGLEYRGIDFSMFWQGVYDRDIYLLYAGTDFISGFPQEGQGYGQAYEHLLGRWTPETAETATFPRLRPGGNGYNNSPMGEKNSFWIRSGNYIRLKHITLGYTLPKTLSEKYLGSAKVKFFVSAQNLWTKAACNLVDPEVIDFSNYPLMKAFNMGINVKF